MIQTFIAHTSDKVCANFEVTAMTQFLAFHSVSA